jgi:hypothetical protein
VISKWISWGEGARVLGEIYLFPLPALVGVVVIKAESLNFFRLEFIKEIPLVLLPTHPLKVLLKLLYILLPQTLSTIPRLKASMRCACAMRRC